MGKSKHRKGHKERVAKYKSNIKKERELLKKRMLDDYIKKQKELLASQEDHTSTQEITGPEIDIQGLNEVSEINNDTLEANISFDLDELNKIEVNDNNNK